MSKVTRDQWIWMPHPAHFICARDCKFFLATKVGDVIVSTVGEYFPDSQIRKIFANSRGVEIEGKGDEYDYNYIKKMGYEDLHHEGWKYETMVFKAEPMPENGCRACAFKIIVSDSKEEEWYKTAEEAVAGHYKLCEKYSNE